MKPTRADTDPPIVEPTPRRARVDEERDDGFERMLESRRRSGPSDEVDPESEPEGRDDAVSERQEARRGKATEDAADERFEIDDEDLTDELLTAVDIEELSEIDQELTVPLELPQETETQLLDSPAGGFAAVATLGPAVALEALDGDANSSPRRGATVPAGTSILDALRDGAPRSTTSANGSAAPGGDTLQAPLFDSRSFLEAIEAGRQAHREAGGPVRPDGLATGAAAPRAEDLVGELRRESPLPVEPQAASTRSESGAGDRSAPGSTSTNGLAMLRVSADDDTLPERLGQLIFSRLKSQNQQFRIRLNPPRLGEMRLDLGMRGGAMNLSIEVESNAVRHLLSSRSVELQQALQKLGVDMEEFRVNLVEFDPADDGAASRDGSGGRPHDSDSSRPSRRHGSPSNASPASDGGTETDDASEEEEEFLRLRTGLIDTRA